MTSLPSIRQGRKMAASPTKASSPTKAPHRKGAPGSGRRQTRFMTQHEQELLKAERIKQSQPIMTKFETSTYRNSYIHNLSVGMLKEGYHESFNELFTLSTERAQKRLKAGPDSILWEERPLDEQYEKLDEMCNFLTKAEYAARLGKWDDVYACRHALAQYFLECGDLWLSDHFFETALDTSTNIKLDGRRRESEANCHMGLACERRGEIEASCEHMQHFYQLTLGRLWTDDDDTNLHHIACRHLCRIFTKLSDRTKNIPEMEELLQKAYDMSKEGEDHLLEAETAYRLGCCYEKGSDSETAIKYLNECLTIATQLKENDLIGKACEALAKSHQTLGGIGKSLEYLEIFAATSKSSGQKAHLVDACNCLGVIYNTLGKYEKSIEHFVSSYSVSQELQEEEEENPEDRDPMFDDSNRPALEQCSVQLGTALGNRLLSTFADNMEIPHRVMMERIVGWKDERENEFGLPLPQPKPATPPPSEVEIPDPTEPFRESESSRQETEGEGGE